MTVNTVPPPPYREGAEEAYRRAKRQPGGIQAEGGVGGPEVFFVPLLAIAGLLTWWLW